MISELHGATWARLTGLRERLPHALLLHGVPGIGKLALAEQFARFLVCEDRQGGQPCGSCDGCRWFLAGNHPDTRIVEPEAIARNLVVPEEDEEQQVKEKKKPSVVIRIDEIRALAGFVNVKSHRAGLRVAIFHPAEEITEQAANSMLKSLEEPPAGAVFLLVSHRPARLLPTIRSRCVSVPVPVPDAKPAAAWLAAQGVRNAECWLAFAGGAPLRALEYATGERGEAIERVLRGVAAGDRGALANAKDREALEPLAEVLQKIALDRAFASITGKTKYGSRAIEGDARAWLAYARAMGRNRTLTRHPLNPRLLAAEMLAGMPEG